MNPEYFRLKTVRLCAKLNFLILHNICLEYAFFSLNIIVVLDYGLTFYKTPNVDFLTIFFFEFFVQLMNM